LLALDAEWLLAQVQRLAQVLLLARASALHMLLIAP
jgi:hypothetical protein